MIYAVAILIPPLALLLIGKPFQAIVNAAVWLSGIAFVLPAFAAIIWAIAAVAGRSADKRTERIVRAVSKRRA